MIRGDRAGSALASVVVCVLVLIVAGSTVAVGQTSSSGTAPSAASPDPMTVGVALAPDVTTTSLVSTEQGGYLSLFAPDGTMYALTIPPNAVLSDLDMTMTLVTSVTGSPLGEELVGAVDIGPSGLQLLQPAMLTITPTKPLPVGQEGPFTARADGADFHMTPLTADPATLTIPILHLTVFGLIQSDQQHRADTLRRTARDVEAQLSQEIAQELQKAREAGGDWDPSPVLDRLQTYRDTVLVPMMAAAETDYHLLGEALRHWLSWERQRQLMGLNEPLDPEILDSFRRGFENYVAHTKERCYAHDFGVVIDYLRLARMDQLLGGVLGLAETDAATFLHNCLTFTLEMDSQVTADLNTCAFIDAGTAQVTQESARPGIGGDALRRPWTVGRSDALGHGHVAREVQTRHRPGVDRYDLPVDRVRRPQDAHGPGMET